MATEYKLSYTAQEIDEKLGKVDNMASLPLFASISDNQDGTFRADTPASAIYKAVHEERRAVYLRVTSGLFASGVFNLIYCDEGSAYFIGIWDDLSTKIIEVGEELAYVYEYELATCEQINQINASITESMQNIETALDSIIAIQESLIGGDGE